jgi:hypothetical protein
MKRVNGWLDRSAGFVTRIVGTMWTALVFAVICCFSLPAVITSDNLILWVQWLGSIFLQLVLLPIIMVGQQMQSASQEAVIRETHDQVLAELADIRAIAQAVHATLKEDS